MPDNGPRQGDDRRFFSKTRIRGKLFSSSDEQASRGSPDRFALNDDVVDFLKPSTSRAKAAGPPPRLAPKLDVSAALRWPNAADVKMKSASPGLPPAISSDSKLLRRKRNLRVDFVRAAPEIIGEGGDEAELPATAVRRRPTGTSSQASAANGPQNYSADEKGMPFGAAAEPPCGGSSQPQGLADSGYGGYSHNEAVQSDSDMNTGFLKRSGTGYMAAKASIARPGPDSEEYRGSLENGDSIRPALPNIQTSFQGSYESTDNHPRLPEIESVIADSPVELRHELTSYLASDPSNPDSLAAKVAQKMKADEGRALQEARRKSQSLAEEDEARQLSSRHELQTQAPSQKALASSYYAIPQAQHPSSHPAESSPADSSPPKRSPASNKSSSAAPRSIPSNGLEPAFTQPTANQHHPSTSSTAKSDTSTNPHVPFVTPNAHDSTPQRRPVPQSNGVQESRSPSALSRSTPPASFQQGHHSNPSLRPSPSTGHTHMIKTPSPGYLAPRSGPNEILATPDQNHDQPSSERVHRGMAHQPSQHDEQAAALMEFSERTTHMRGIFRLMADVERPHLTYTPMQCLRAALWWFLKGRAGLEILIWGRSQSPDTRQSTKPKEQLSQPHVDLAKTSWIISEVMENHPVFNAYQSIPSKERAASAVAANDIDIIELLDVVELITFHLKGIMSSMKRNQFMPPENALIQGQDQSIWVKYPQFTSDMLPILSGQPSRALAETEPPLSRIAALLLPIGDSKNDFIYGRAFATASMSTDDPETDRVQFPCVVSIVRSRGDWVPKVMICTQSELMSLTISGERQSGPTWREVDWRPRMNTIYVQLPCGFTLVVELSERDFALLYSVFNRSNQVEASLAPAEDEKLISEIALLDSHYIDPARPQAFPPERVPRCRVRVFEKIVRKMDFGGERRFHLGYRLLLVTSPKVRLLYSVSHDLSMLSPLNVEFMSDKQTNGAPAVILRFKTEETPANMYLVFNDPKERLALYTVLNGSSTKPGESLETRISLKSLSVQVVDQDMKFSVPPNNPLEQLHWQDLHVINVDMEGRTPIESTKTVMSESLRIVARNAAGAVVDRMNLGPGKLQLRLSVTEPTSLSLLRGPQTDMTLSLDPSRVDQHTPVALDALLQSLSDSPSIRTFTFQSLQDLHAFQVAITGYAVLFDSVASTFAISRRRMVVPIYKQWASSNVRVQVVQFNSMIQLLVFFSSFTHADAMAIKLQAMDVFHKEKPFAVRLVDAKFPLPDERNRAVEDSFIALEAGAYPGEHDDIVVGFEAEETRDRFLQALPAQTQTKKLSFKRKI